MGASGKMINRRLETASRYFGAGCDSVNGGEATEYGDEPEKKRTKKSPKEIIPDIPWRIPKS